jgi:hypothetical protein
MREDIEAWLDGGGAEEGEDFVLVGEFLVVAAVVAEHHVNEGTGDEDKDR